MRLRSVPSSGNSRRCQPRTIASGARFRSTGSELQCPVLPRDVANSFLLQQCCGPRKHRIQKHAGRLDNALWHDRFAFQTYSLQPCCMESAAQALRGRSRMACTDGKSLHESSTTVGSIRTLDGSFLGVVAQTHGYGQGCQAHLQAKLLTIPPRICLTEAGAAHRSRPDSRKDFHAKM